MTRILLIDDHPVVRLGVRRILIAHFTPVFIGEAGDADTGTAMALNEEWDVVVLDITMPGAVGLDVLKHLREARGVFTMDVHDNGRGITKAQLTSRSAIGLLGMREAVEPFGGTLSITGRRGRGTRVVVRFPISRSRRSS